jgi:hypothetical protein
VLELVELGLQLPIIEIAVEFLNAVVELLPDVFRTWPTRTLAPVHTKRLLALLHGPTAAATKAAYQCRVRSSDAPSFILWLARQPGAVTVAAELGLTAADVKDPAAVALLFDG